MKYSIYKNLPNSDFEVLKEKLYKIEPLSSSLMERHNFNLNRDSYNDILALDYLYKEGIFFGNIGLAFIDTPVINGNYLFAFYITKTYDENDKRFFKKIVLEEKYTIDKIIEKSKELFDQSLLIFNSIEKEQLLDVIEIKQ